MQTVIYIDSIFFINFIMDLFLLELATLTLKKTATLKRIIAGSFIGAGGYCLILCLPGISYDTKMISGMFATILLMAKIGCKTNGIRELLRTVGYLFTYAFFIGGFLLFLIKKNPFGQTDNISAIYLVTIGYIGFRICLWGIKRYQEKRNNHFCKVILCGDEGPLQVYGLIDTGNGLIEPISKKPVAILEECVWDKMKNSKKPDKYKIIPFHSIGKENGILEGYEIEKVQIEYGKEKKEVTNVPVAIFKGKLSVKGEYQVVLPPGWSF